MEFIKNYINETASIVNQVDARQISAVINVLASIKEKKGRLFFVGVGGGAGHASHAVNDFRKIAGIESYSVSDNVSELTARINDEGWDTCYSEWLKTSACNERDGIFVFSVGGGNIPKRLSVNIVRALEYGKSRGCKVIGIIGRDDGYTAEIADAYVLVPKVNSCHLTAHTEAFQAVIWHLIISHPKLMAYSMKWESTEGKG